MSEPITSPLSYEKEEKQQKEIIEIVYERMFKKFVKELFKGCQKENSDGTDSIWGKDQTLLRKKKKTHTSLSKEQFLY